MCAKHRYRKYQRDISISRAVLYGVYKCPFLSVCIQERKLRIADVSICCYVFRMILLREP